MRLFFQHISIWSIPMKQIIHVPMKQIIHEFIYFISFTPHVPIMKISRVSFLVNGCFDSVDDRKGLGRVFAVMVFQYKIWQKIQWVFVERDLVKLCDPLIQNENTILLIAFQYSYLEQKLFQLWKIKFNYKLFSLKLLSYEIIPTHGWRDWNNHPKSKLIVQPSTFNLQPSTFNLQPSTFNLQMKRLSLLMMTIAMIINTLHLILNINILI